MRRSRLVLLVLVAGAVVWALVALASARRGVRVTVVNAGPAQLSNVVVHVTGNAHNLGDLGVGQSGTVRVRPRSESHVEVEFVDKQGQRHRLIAGGYFESDGYRGTIEIELEDGVIRRTDDHVTLTCY